MHICNATPHPMKQHHTRVTPVRKEPPDLERVVAALLAFALLRRAEEAEVRRGKEAREQS